MSTIKGVKQRGRSALRWMRLSATPVLWLGKRLHSRTSKRLHIYLLRKFKAYERWFAWEYHRHVHAAGSLAAVITVISVLLLNAGGVSALSAWSQSDWSGGVGGSTTNQYQSANNIDTSGNELKLADSFQTATFKGNQLANGSTNLGSATADQAVQFNSSQEFDSNTYDFSSSQTTRASVKQDGDYFLSLTMPINSDNIEDASNRSDLMASVWVNGVQEPVGVATSGYIRNYSGHFTSSDHLAVMLHDLHAGDYIQVKVHKTTSTSHTLTSNYTMYLSKTNSDQNVFSATATRTVSSTNLNGGSSPLEWTSVRQDSGYTHSNSGNSQNITLDSAGKYFVAVNVPLSGTSQRTSVLGNVSLGGNSITTGSFRQGYIRSYNGQTESSIHWSGLVDATSANQVLGINLSKDASTGTVTTGGKNATIFVQKLPDNSVLATQATSLSNGSTNWNSASKTPISWNNDTVGDSSTYTHSTSSNNKEITVKKAGDYMLAFNASFYSTVQRANIITTVQVNGNDVPGAETASGYMRSASGHNNSSEQLLFPINGLSPGDKITVSVQQEAVNGTVTLTQPAALMLWRTDYQTSGTLTSNVFNAGYPADWKQLDYVTAGSGAVEVRVRTSNNADMSGAPAFSACAPIASGLNADDSSCANDTNQYAQYQVTLKGDNGQAEFKSISLSYVASDTVPPSENASNVLLKTGPGGTNVNSNAWLNHKPYASWDAGQDNNGGSGVAGYCLYLGQDPTGNPRTTKGYLGSSPMNTGGACQFAVSGTDIDLSAANMIGQPLTSSTSPYYLNVLAIDVAGNVYGGTSASFHFRFDNTAPANPAFVSAPSQFVSSKTVNLTWPTTGAQAASDSDSGVAGLQYKIGSSGTWYGSSHSGSQDSSDLLSDNGSYTTQDNPDFNDLQEGNNLVYFRTWDKAGNVSSAYVTSVIKLNTNAPSGPQNLTAAPNVNTSNSFAFSWLKPANYQGSGNNIKYCYTVNVLPTANNCIFTNAGQTSLPAGAYATAPGQNTIYVVAKDEAGNINYATAASTNFTANTPAPGTPLNLDVADISIKAKQVWKVALSWEKPTNVGAGIANYRVMRSTDGSNFSQVATTAGASFVDTGLNQQTYYYRIKACDSANNCGVETSPVHIVPTGKFTSPANLTSGPNFATTTRSATIDWTTDRNSDSQVEYGLKPNHYFTTAASNSDQTTYHSIKLDNLDAGTTYYYRAMWTDADGNTGTSSEGKLTTKPAPTVSNVKVSDINLNQAIINFSSKGASAIKLYYGPNGNYGNVKKINTSTSSSSYTLPLSNLVDGTNYTYRLNPIDNSGYEYKNSTSLSFTTPPAPKITNIAFEPVTGALTGTETVTWETNVPATSLITYQLADGGGQHQIVDTKMTTKHKMTMSGLTYNTRYSLVANSRDNLGNTASSDTQIFHTGLDTRPPTLSDVVLQPTIRGTGTSSSGQITVSWKTDKPGTSQVAYGSGSGGGFTSKTAEDSALVTNHVVVISHLPTSQVFHVQALSRDHADNIGKSAGQTTIVGQATDSAIGIVFNALRAVFGL